MRLTFPEMPYLRWAKAMPAADINLARSGVEHCPASKLQLRPSDIVTNLPVRYGYAPLKEAIARRYRVNTDQVFTVSGGTTFANWVACVAALDGSSKFTEVIVERPTYEQVLQIPRSLGCRLRRLDRRLDDNYAIDLDEFARLVTSKTRLAIVTNLHNPSGARIDMPTLRAMALILARVKAYLLVDEVYLECLFGPTSKSTDSCVHAGPNVITTNSLTKAYGLDGLRAGWILGPPEIIERAIKVHNLVANNGVAPGERMSLAAFKHLPAISERSHKLLDPNLRRLRSFLARETRLQAHVPEGGNVIFPYLPRGIDGDALADRLRDRYSTLIVPGRFFESPRHIRLSFGLRGPLLDRGLDNITRALNDLTRGQRVTGR
jgi:aspartate/methionine/tyrosine aminotransferase